MNDRTLTRRPLFWVFVAVLVAGSVTFAVRNFTEAFPVANIELEMDRVAALGEARALAEERGWGPDAFRQAASFGDPDPEVRVYLELELGEDDAIGRLVSEGEIHPYRWQVRHFTEGETREALIRFTPAGAPYGFRLTLPEDAPGAALPADEARALAEAAAIAPPWGVDLARFERVESSQETRPSGRVDHTLVYERIGTDLGDADIRLRLRVSGDELTELTHTVRVPEAFSLRYAEMRTANTRLALIASLLFIGLFLVVGCGGGLFYLIRTRWLEWKTPLAWGAIVAGVMALASLNQLPLAWMGYDTALDTSTFLFEQFALAIGIFAAGPPFLALIFMVAESLGRRAFPRQPQQWRFWHPDVARSAPALGRTIGGYAVAAIEIGFVIAFYLWATRREGWWMPSEALIQPDLLATAFPWLTAVSIALFSGFWEEALFRAVPIAGAALIGARYGGRRWWILAALILQAAVFAAAHADYPQQPSYARLAELFLPALFWGVLYIWFGLVPVIIAHAGYNLTLISIPIWVDRIAIVAIGLIPLWIVLWHVGRKGFRPQLPALASHAAWRPPEEHTPEPAPTAPTATVPPEPGRAREGRGAGEGAPAGEGVPAGQVAGHEEGSPAHPVPIALPARPFLVGCALVGIVLLAVGLRVPADVGPLELDRGEAVEAARALLAERGFTLDEEWRALPVPIGGTTPAHRFVWDEGGPESYRALLGNYLRTIGWEVRFARFTGPVEERAEEFRVSLQADRTVRAFSHRLPEGRAGPILPEEEARILATAELERVYGLAPALVEEVSAVSTQHPDRLDWTFIWSDPVAWELERGEARLRVGIAGDRVSGLGRFVHVPEEWEREQQAKQARLAPLTTLRGFLGFLLLGGAAFAGLVVWARGGLDRRAAAVLAGVGAILFLIPIWNAMPVAGAGFTTTQGFGEQLLISMGIGTLGMLLAAAALGLAAGLAHGWLGADPERPFLRGRPAGAPHPALLGGALGLLLAGLPRAAGTLGPTDPPALPGTSAAGDFVPWLSVGLSAGFTLLLVGMIFLLILLVVDRATAGWTTRKSLGVGMLLVFGFIPAPTIAETLWMQAGVGLAAGLIFLGVHRLARSWGVAFVPWLAATLGAIALISPLLHPGHGGARLGALLGLALVAVIAHRWSRYIEAKT